MTAEAHIVGAYEHPRRRIDDRTVFEVLGEVVTGALRDAGVEQGDVDGFFCDATLGGNPLAAVEYLGFDGVRYVDSTDGGGASYLVHVAHAARALTAGECSIAVIAMAGIPRLRSGDGAALPHDPFESVHGVTQPALYALAASRHMFEYGTTSEQLAEVRVAASIHASHNPNAMFRDRVTVEDVLASPLIADPLHRLDCCGTSDGGGALVLTTSDIARRLGRRSVSIRGYGSAIGHGSGGFRPLERTAAAESGPRALAQAGVGLADIQYASIYDSFTITVIETLEDLGFCKKGEGGHFVSDGALVAPHGRLPINTDGGGLCNNHPGRRGGMPRTIEAVRQLRGEAHPALQIPDCSIALVHGTGGAISTRHTSATLVLAAGGF